MQLHTLKSNSARKTKIRRGRGGKRGTFSGRGTKGQKARAGRRIYPEMRDLIKKIPKKKGYNQTFAPKTIVAVKASIIVRKFKAGETITPKLLVARGVIHRIAGKTPRVKILAPGDLLKSFNVKDCELVKS
ncbi:MAG: uL15 family ribosomal protein [Patescibacteria group bacterium]